MAHIVTNNCDGCRFTRLRVALSRRMLPRGRQAAVHRPRRLHRLRRLRRCVSGARHLRRHRSSRRLIPWIAVNAERAAKLPVIRARQEPLPAPARRQELGF